MSKSPQCENGFTRIANELLEAILLRRIPGQELRIVLTVIRKTYGFKKKSDQISYGQIAKATGIPRTRVIVHIKSLVSKKVLGSLNNGTRQPSTIWINKDYSQWIDSPIKETSPKEGTRVVPKKGLLPSLMIGVPQKKEEKETIQKKKPSVETSDKVRPCEVLSPAVHFVIALKIADWVRSQKKVNITNGKITVWANQIRLLIEKDLIGKREEKETRINEAFEWFLKNAEDQYTPVVESGSSFRKKFTQIEAAMKRNQPQSPQTVSELMKADDGFQVLT